MKAFSVLVTVLIWDGVFSLPSGYKYIDSPDFFYTGGIVADVQTNPFLHPDSLQLNQNQFFNGPFISNVNPFYNFTSASDTVPFESYFNPTEFDAQGHYISAETPLIPFTTPTPFFDKVYPLNPVISRQYLPLSTGSQIPKAELNNPERSRLNFAPTTVTQASIESTSAANLTDIPTSHRSSDATIFSDQLSSANIAESSTSVTLSLNFSDNNKPKKSISALKCDAYAQEIKDITNGGENKRLSIDTRHMVALGRRASDGKFVLMCSGALISHFWVLTAAHCTYGPSGGLSEALLSTTRLSNQLSITIRIENTILHPKYVAPTKYADIALVKLVSAVIFGSSVRPACLYQYNETDYTKTASVIGWSITDAGSLRDILQVSFSLSPVNNPNCATQLRTSNEIPYGIMPSMMCAINRFAIQMKLLGEPNDDSCHDRSGAPLVVPHEKHPLREVLGITSIDADCTSNFIGVYTRVSYYLSWIEDIVWSQEQ